MDRNSGKGPRIARLRLAAALAAAGVIALGAAFLQAWKKETAAPPEQVLKAYCASLDAMSDEAFAAAAHAAPCQTEEGRALLACCRAACAARPSSAAEVRGRRAEIHVMLETLDLAAYEKELGAAMEAAMAETVEQARVASDVYEEDGRFRPEVVRKTFAEQFLPDRTDLSACLLEREFTARLSFRRGAWTLDNAGELAEALLPAWEDGPDAAAGALFAATSAELPYIPKHYRLSEGTLCGLPPVEENFGSTRDPARIRALLETSEARALIGGQPLAWNEEIRLLDDTEIRYYLDETILALVWQEETAGAYGTFSEVFLSDASQLIRRIGGDSYGSDELKPISAFAADSNAVLAISADFYHFVYRDYGALVYQRELCRFNPRSCDSCFFTADGDMLFVRADQFADSGACERFIADNDVVFSVAFGPVLIDDGVDVTPSYYRYGEINEPYARAAIGMLGERHYLTMNINHGPGHGNLVTLRRAADEMIGHGCRKAYTLDGGQTGETVFRGEVINPLQKPWERPQSDAICFVSAWPGAE